MWAFDDEDLDDLLAQAERDPQADPQWLADLEAEAVARWGWNAGTIFGQRS
jgi:hypothetical protein